MKYKDTLTAGFSSPHHHLTADSYLQKRREPDRWYSRIRRAVREAATSRAPSHDE
ncbi:hypothetical protein OIG03_10680 [Neisseria meningitidis]|uniref:hypothetical protein n=1 Tax=Neisseria meningitidis TaxID=487 RepID=UPI001297D36D|nr:hypothetical protein [Neisseria meningitidis]MBJ7852085.1 hypothetical protein [Neisseria meningitidis]MCL5723893.1 hypothetical protein [Neisseria meningitidis]MCL5891343.1 hypothetical protein [Neisseria meningitidis]MCL5897163.1 hypothetical protein [Neisseria meningitidis]MCL5937127.1 hypothetical protein [Neisseria meningitidis]